MYRTTFFGSDSRPSSLLIISFELLTRLNCVLLALKDHFSRAGLLGWVRTGLWRDRLGWLLLGKEDALRVYLWQVQVFLFASQPAVHIVRGLMIVRVDPGPVPTAEQGRIIAWWELPWVVLVLLIHSQAAAVDQHAIFVCYSATLTSRVVLLLASLSCTTNAFYIFNYVAQFSVSRVVVPPWCCLLLSLVLFWGWYQVAATISNTVIVLL